MYFQQQQPSFLEGLISGFMQQREKNQERKMQADMYGDIANFGNNLNNLDYGGQTTTQDLASRQNPNSNYTNKTMETKVAQGLLPTSFNQSPQTANMIGQGLFGQGSMQSPEQQPTSLEQAIAPAQTAMNQYSKDSNPVKTTVSAPKTLQEQTSMIKSQLAPAMKELIAKGYNPKDVLPLLQQATNDKIAEHTQNYQQQQMNDLYQGFLNEENPNRKAMYAARLKNMGYDVTTAYKEFAPDYVDKVVDSGDAQNLLSFDKKSGKYYDGGKLAKSVSPDARLNADTRIQTTGMNNATALQAAAMRASAARSGGGSRSNNYQDGAGTKNGKRLDPLEKQKYGELYNTLLEDIWDSATPAIRAQKIQQHAQDLNELGYYMDRDVQNDLDAITG